MRRPLAVLGVALLLTVIGATAVPAAAQDTDPTNEVPTQDIVPKPNSGQAPEDAGDRGGALQLLVLALIVGAVGVGGWHLSRQARRARPRPPSPG